MSYERGMLIGTQPKKTDACDDEACYECTPQQPGETTPIGGSPADVFHGDPNGDMPHPVAFLPHSCDAWVIGGPEQVRALIADLQAWLAEAEKP